MSPAPSTSPISGQTSASSAGLALDLPEELVEAIARRAAAIVLTELAAARAPSPYMTIQDAAAYLCCKRQRIDDLLSARSLTRIKDGRRTLVLRSEVEALPEATTGPAANASERDWMPGEGRATVTHPGNTTR